MQVAWRFRNSRQMRKPPSSVISLKLNWPFYCHLFMLQGYLCWLLTHCPNTWVLLKAHENASTQLPERWDFLIACTGWGEEAVWGCQLSFHLISPDNCLLHVFFSHIILCRCQFSGLTPGPNESQVLGWGRGPRQSHRVTLVHTQNKRITFYISGQQICLK